MVTGIHPVTMNIAKAALLFILTLAQTHALVTPEFALDAPADALSNKDETWPAVAFNGSVYVVAWQAQIATNAFRVHFKRFNAIGEPMGEVESLSYTNFALPEIASNGRDFLLIGRTAMTDAGVALTAAVRLDHEGKLIADSYIGPVALGEFPKIASDGTDYMIFASWPSPKFCRVTGAGFGPVMDVAGDQGTGNSIAFGGGSYLAAWGSASSPTRNVLAHRISATGALLTQTPDVIAGPSQVTFGASVAFSAGTFLVTWQETLEFTSKVLGRRVSTAGAILDANPLTIVPANAGTAIIGPHDDGFIATWYHFDYLNYVYETCAATISSSGTVAAPLTLSTRASPAIQQIALNDRGTNTMVAWATHSAETAYDVFVNFIPAGGTVGTAQTLERGPNFQSAPAAALGANGYLVVWQDNRNALSNADDIFGMFIEENGRRKSQPFAIASNGADESSPTVAAAGDRYLVVWREGSPTSANDNLHAALLINQEVAMRFPICTEANSQRGAAAASNGKDFLVVWRDERERGADNIFGMHVSRDGVLFGPPNGFPISIADHDQQAVSIASNGTNYLVAWRDQRNSDTRVEDDIYGAIVEAGQTNNVLNIPISVAYGPQRGPDAASNGRDYFVTWRDGRNDNGNAFVEIWGTPVAATGEAANANGLPLTEPADEQRQPALVRSGENYLLAWLQRTGAGPVNAFAREILSNGQPASAPIKASPTDYDEETLDLAGNPAGTALMLSQTASPYYGPVGRIRGAIVCVSNCPVVIDVSFASDGRTLTWNAEPTQTYRVEFKDDLNSLTWQALTETTASTSGGFLDAKDIAATSTRFYRIVRVP